MLRDLPRQHKASLVAILSWELASMQSPDIAFYRYFQTDPRPRGLGHIKGRQDLDLLPPDFRAFLAVTQDVFNRSFRLSEGPLAELGRSMVPYLDYLESQQECAHAFESGGCNFIGISIPVIERLRNSAEQLVRAEQVHSLLRLRAGDAMIASTSRAI